MIPFDGLLKSLLEQDVTDVNSAETGRADHRLRAEPLLSVRDLRIELRGRQGIGEAVSGVSFDVRRGETLGLVGESGSGKSLTALAVLRLLPEPMAKIVSGRIEFDGEDILAMSVRELRDLRGNRISMVLQDPLTALNPSFTIGNQITESLRLHTTLRGEEVRERVVELLDLMKIPHPSERIHSYPHQFSGGMRQRVVGSIALAAEPELLIADEPTTSLDVTVQAAYLELLKDLRERYGMSMLFITHDFGVIRSVCDRVAVMYAGRLVETAPTETVFRTPHHPYTRALIGSVPDIRRPSPKLVTIRGTPPSIYDQPAGCRFHERCWLYEQLGRPESCRTVMPEMAQVESGVEFACHFPQEAATRPMSEAQGSSTEDLGLPTKGIGLLDD